MELRYTCFVVRHEASGRVTVIPLDLPALAVHAVSVERALEDLALAVDDRVGRAHPGRVAGFVPRAPGRAAEVEVPVIPVWGREETVTRPLPVTVVVRPAHRPYVEVLAPRLGLRLWLTDGPDLLDEAARQLARYLEKRPEWERLALHPEAREVLEELPVTATPAKLASLRYRELDLPERPPPGADEDGDEEDDDDAYDLGPRRRKKPKRRPLTPTLRRLGVALHELAAEGALDRAYERDDRVEALARRLDARDPEPVVLVGPAGVGKTAVVHELARRLAARAKEKGEDARPFYFVDAARMIAGRGFLGEWQQQLYAALEEARAARAVLFVGHVVDLLDAGKSVGSDHNAAQVLGPALAAREVAVLGEATPEAWARLERRNQGFALAWSPLRVDEPPYEVTARILGRVADDLRREHAVAVAPDAVANALALARRFWPYGSLVGNAVTLARRLVAGAAHRRASRVSGEDAIGFFSAESGIPLVLLRDDLALDAADVRAFLRARVIGQEAAVARVAEVVAVIKAGLADVKRPVAVLVFAGPTGVGKTELAKSLAEYVFGARDRMVRLDMGEYAGPDALARLVGDEGAPGHLVAAVRRQAFCVVLLDEVEKAHPAVFDALLGVLGEGRLTDADGRFTDFRNAVIIMTSNLGADTLRAGVGFGAGEGAAGRDAVRAHYVTEARRFFRPELFNRVDDFVVFDPLGAREVRAIVAREVAHVTAREGLRRRDATLVVTDAALDLLAARGLDPRYGARPLKRALERDLVAPVATLLAERPQHEALRLTADAGRGALAVTAEHPGGGGGGGDGAVRGGAERVLTLASELRGEARRWARSSVANGLRARLAYHEKASRLPGFWKDRGVAEDETRRADIARALVGDLDALERHVRAAEDLAFEAWHERSPSMAGAVEGEVALLRRTLGPLKEKLYATLHPPRPGVLLYFMCERAAWRWVPWLLDAYLRWCKGRDLKTTVFATRYVEPRHPADVRRNPDALWRWEARTPAPEETPMPAAVALAVTGPQAQVLLEGEHGVHRVYDGGTPQDVKVKFEPASVALPSSLAAPSRLVDAMPSHEVRRLTPGREALRDLRTGAEVRATPTEGFALAPLLDAYMTWRVLAPEAEPWS